jgi:hypothetical protein
VKPLAARGAGAAAGPRRGRGRGSFTPWFWSYGLAARLEALLVACVFVGVIVILCLLVQIPGPLVVHVADDLKEPIKNARVRCTSPDGATSYAGLTDVFGEAKWPGLAKGSWKCEVTPPPSYFAKPEVGFATVVARKPAMWTTVVERPARLLVSIRRPTGAPRAAVAVRAVCDGDPAAAWEARAGILDGRALVYVPHGRNCRAGLVRAELPSAGPVTAAQLDCDHEPCSAEVSAGVGQLRELALTPTREQWEAVRPPPEPD